MKKKDINWSEIIRYIIFGVLTTVVNMLVFFICRYLTIDYRISNVLAWIFSVMFAYVTNKYFVFKKRNQTKKENFKEMVSFYSVRLVSLGIDMVSMIILIELIHLSDFWAKAITQVLVVALNYIFSKIFVFKEKNKR